MAAFIAGGEALIRKPVVAGRFYSADSSQLRRDVSAYLASGEDNGGREKIWGAMLPHAGHVFCGEIIGRTLSGAILPSRLIILCPNHTGYGKPLGVWPEGSWLTPFGAVKVDAGLAAEIVSSNGGFESDISSHLGEHSIEVLLPFLQSMRSDLTIVPICVGVRNPAILEKAGAALAQVLEKPENSDTGIVISSDMNHYESHERTLQKDGLALERALAGDPAGLLKITGEGNISMCGAAPLALALYCAQKMGKFAVTLTGHATSGPVSGDMDHTVGYAGLRIKMENMAQ